jgi:GT2 family glycosyltransferase
MTRRSAFEEVGGFAPSTSVGYSDVDYCLRLGELGYRVVFQPFAHLRQRQESSNDEVFGGEALECFRGRWGQSDRIDPYYNPNFLRDDPQFAYGVD